VDVREAIDQLLKNHTDQYSLMWNLDHVTISEQTADQLRAMVNWAFEWYETADPRTRRVLKLLMDRKNVPSKAVFSVIRSVESEPNLPGDIAAAMKRVSKELLSTVDRSSAIAESVYQAGCNGLSNPDSRCYCSMDDDKFPGCKCIHLQCIPVVIEDTPDAIDYLKGADDGDL
jgi:hypothetical protein